MQTRLFDDPDLVQFYDIENGWADDDCYCQELALGKRTVLDLGCGTGRLAAALAPGREVFGVDPAAAMLTTARQRVGGSAVTWRLTRGVFASGDASTSSCWPVILSGIPDGRRPTGRLRHHCGPPRASGNLCFRLPRAFPRRVAEVGAEPLVAIN
jgi:SAM-dependent methyltransferase